eukprot:NODE_2900_length_973_cov_57.975177_g2880_i0.p1 GENE.NODE_2900_length_973_cov_57.975177_g2880_i0~~NODE_2900_length_973_cov_57.975177_g2880_i0.p1  ORF type:complete len:318 (+),score=66.85 NODE_2900_length_973_cov_57.975177_g2880_i0:66-956(+)
MARFTIDTVGAYRMCIRNRMAAHGGTGNWETVGQYESRQQKYTYLYVKEPTKKLACESCQFDNLVEGIWGSGHNCEQMARKAENTTLTDGELEMLSALCPQQMDSCRLKCGDHDAAWGVFVRQAQQTYPPTCNSAVGNPKFTNLTYIDPYVRVFCAGSLVEKNFPCVCADEATFLGFSSCDDYSKHVRESSGGEANACGCFFKRGFGKELAEPEDALYFTAPMDESFAGFELLRGTQAAPRRVTRLEQGCCATGARRMFGGGTLGASGVPIQHETEWGWCERSRNQGTRRNRKFVM